MSTTTSKTPRERAEAVGDVDRLHARLCEVKKERDAAHAEVIKRGGQLVDALKDADSLRFEAEQLRAALAAFVEWQEADFDTIADLFYRETGFMRLGKDQPAGIAHTYEERSEAWNKWIKERKEKLIQNALGALRHGVRQ